MISETLKTTTRPAHDSIENAVNLVEVTKDEATYPEVLKAFYGYYLPLEAKLFSYKDQFNEVGIQIEDRLKTSLIRRDLETLGYSFEEIEKIPYCEELPFVENFYSAMGVLYVLEGSTLGGQIICRNIKSSDLFFRAYGEKTHLMWTAFKEILNKLPEENESILVSSAKETFLTLNKWLAHFNFKSKTH